MFFFSASLSRPYSFFYRLQKLGWIFNFFLYVIGMIIAQQIYKKKKKKKNYTQKQKKNKKKKKKKKKKTGTLSVSQCATYTVRGPFPTFSLGLRKHASR